LSAYSGAGLSIAVTRATAYITTSAATTARVWGGTILAGGAAVVTAAAVQTATVITDTVSVAGAAGDVVLPTARIQAATRARLESPTRSVGGELGATSVNHATVTSNLVGVSGVGVRKIGAIAEITSAAATEAPVLLAASALNAAGGDVTMTVSADNLVRAKVDQTSVGFVDIALIQVTATIDALTRGSIAAMLAASRDLAITVSASNVATTATNLTSVSVGGGTGLTSRATLTGVADTIAELLLGTSGLTATG